ncbi:putative quinate permease [Colletotrichum shisoi]|uniref:Putative quinate permease n=1 Tax=Colletotrichum shisoi TaxID=2078593 RepID=A0A5Q4BAY1_9PEZI|nr:putative quinate permease [Colletotrichum shisoi]
MSGRAAQDQQILNAAGSIGIFVSAFATGFISDIFGCKKTIGMLFGGKVIATFGFGPGLRATHWAPCSRRSSRRSKMRGVCLVLVNTMITVGQWLNCATVLASDHYKNDLPWRIPLITQLIPPGLLLCGWAWIQGIFSNRAPARKFKSYVCEAGAWGQEEKKLQEDEA